jgi:hypothetical protein
MIAAATRLNGVEGVTGLGKTIVHHEQEQLEHLEVRRKILCIQRPIGEGCKV